MRATMITLAAAAVCLTVASGTAVAATPAATATPTTTHRLSGADATNPEGSSVVMNAAGSAVALWYTGKPETPRAYVALRTAKGAWGAAHAINAKGTSADASVGIDSTGRVVVVWGQGTVRGGANRYVFWSQHQPGGTWTKARTIAVPKGSHLTDFRLAANGAGVASLSTYGAAYAQVLTRSGTWRKAVALSRVTTPPDSAGSPSVGDVHAVVTPGGAVTAAWEWDRLISRTAYCVTYQRGGLTAAGKATPVVTMAAHQCSEQQPTVSLSSSPTGASVAAYWSTGKAVRVAYRMAGGVWHTHAVAARGDDTSASVTLEGNRIWVWTAVTDLVAGRTTIAAARYNGRWGALKTIRTYRETGGDENTIPQSATILAVLTSTQQTVAWTVTRYRGEGATVRSWVKGGKTTETALPAQNSVLALAAGGRHYVAVCEAPVKQDYTFRYYTREA